MDKLRTHAPSRVVHVTSAMYKRGQIDFDDLNISKKPYSAKIAFEQAAAAIVLTNQEFCRRYSGTVNC